jgi:hypothetical protein
MVRCVQPAHGQLIDLETQEGDVVLLGTDGLCVAAAAGWLDGDDAPRLLPD